MPIYTYKCDVCSGVEHIESTINDYVADYSCEVEPSCTGRMQRWYAGTAPALGKVKGAGHSPLRGST